MDTETSYKWHQFLKIIEDNIGAERFATWFSETRLIGYADNRISIGLPSQFFFEKYEDDFYDLITSTLRRVYGPDVKLEYEVSVIKNDDRGKVHYIAPEQSHVIKNKTVRSVTAPANPLVEQSEDAIFIDSQLNETLCFENYCVGESNILPFTIAKFISENPGKAEFNPFFLYGDVGVGKTHLMQAIGIRIKENNPVAKVLFMPMKQFQYLFAGASIKKEIPKFIAWYQQFDALLFDDIQELSFKPGTMDALFQVFNYLYLHNKVLAFTSDRAPLELDGLTDRLIDRFRSGITEKLEKPDVELRKRILHFKASKNGLDMPQDVLDLIAGNTNGSVRELESIMMGILTRSINFNTPITVNLARDVLKTSTRKATKAINFDMIVDATSEYFSLNPDVIFSKNRVRDVADARQIIMYLADKLIKLSSTTIGQRLNRKHTTVLHGIKTIKDRCDTSDSITKAVEIIESRLMK